MKIRCIHLLRLRSEIPDGMALPLPSFITGGIYILQVETDEGLIGLGEPSPYGASPEKMAEALESPLMRTLLGKDPLADDAVPPQPGFSGGYRLSADQALLAGYSQAIWDLRGKIQGTPLHRLLAPDAPADIAAYASAGMWHDDPGAEDALVQEALRFQSEGFWGYKLRPATPRRQAGSHLGGNNAPPPVDVDRLLQVLVRIRQAVGDEWPLMVDAGARLYFEDACRLGAFMQEARFAFFEEPLPRRPQLYEQLKGVVRVPLAGGEFLSTARDFEPWLAQGALDVLQPDVNLCGIEELRKIDEQAHLQGRKMVLHNWANEISSAASLAVAVGSQTCRLVECNRIWNPFRGRVCIGGPELERGRLRLSDRPGLGITLDEASVNQFLAGRFAIQSGHG